MATLITPNMNLPEPVVGSESGPQYATDINACMTIIDQHDHTTGNGVQITPAGLNINSALVFNSQDATGLRSVRFTAQGSPLAGGSDLGCLYESGVDLYYNDGSGNQVRITQSGGVAGSPGSISNLTAPASASYVAANTKFVWQSAANTSAYMDCSSILMRNLTANSHALTLQAPAAMAADYSITLPALPASQKIMTLDASGVVSAPYTVDGSTITIAANVIGVPSGGIGTTQLASSSVTTAKIADNAVTAAKLAAAAIGISSDAANVAIPQSPTAAAITNTTGGIVTGGRPVVITLQPTVSTIGYFTTPALTTIGIQLVRGVTVVTTWNLYNGVSGVVELPSSLTYIDNPGAGTFTYYFQAYYIGSNGSPVTTHMVIAAYSI